MSGRGRRVRFEVRRCREVGDKAPISPPRAPHGQGVDDPSGAPGHLSWRENVGVDRHLHSQAPGREPLGRQRRQEKDAAQQPSPGPSTSETWDKKDPEKELGRWGKAMRKCPEGDTINWVTNA